MKWNETGVRFARPIRWLVALYGGSVLHIDAAGIKASNQTKGHRVLGGGKWVSVRDVTSYVNTLERHGVVARIHNAAASWSADRSPPFATRRDIS